jgi:hypothetical protein
MGRNDAVFNAKLSIQKNNYARRSKGTTTICKKLETVLLPAAILARVTHRFVLRFY